MRQRVLAAWSSGLAVVGVLMGLVVWTDRPPAPRPETSPASEFSEARAMGVVKHLTEDIGLRVQGTPAQAAAAEYLATRLRELPGVEVDVQTVEARLADTPRGDMVLAPRVTNVVARIRGRSESAVLLSAHYDSPPESVGAADDAAAVGALVEVARALSSGPVPLHSVLIVLNGAEEGWLLGSTAFVDHPWAKHLRAFINLESAGAGGKAILFQSGPGNAWLLDAYARAAPHPYGTVIGQDLFQSGAIHSETDFRIYRDRGGLRGLDMALFQDGYVYHTALDRMSRLEPGSLQHLGDNTLAITRELAGRELPQVHEPEPGVYYDLLGVMMVTYTRTEARVLAGLALLLGCVVLGVALRRTPMTVGGWVRGVGLTWLAAGAGLLLALGASLLPGLVFHRPHGWFSAPWLAVLTFGACALAGSLGVHALWARRGGDAHERARRVWAGGLVLWMLVLVLLTWTGLGMAYLALWWVVSGAVGLLLATLRPSWSGAALLLGFVPGALVSVQVTHVLLALVIPLSGRLLLPLPFDPIIAALVALPVVGAFALGAPAFHRVGGLGGAAAFFGGVGLLALGAMTVRFPYTPERPKRVWVVHEETWGQPARLLLQGFDFPSLQEVARQLPAADWAPRARARYQELTRPAEPARLAPPVLQVVSSQPGPPGERSVRLRVEAPDALEFTLTLPRNRVLGWDFPEPLPTMPGEALVTLDIHAPGARGWEFTVRLRGDEPVPVECTTYLLAPTSSLEQLRAQLPEWTTAFFSVSMKDRIQL